MGIFGSFLLLKFFLPLIHHSKAQVFGNSDMKLDFAYSDSFDRRLPQNALWSVFCSYTFIINFDRNDHDQGLFRSSLFYKERLFLHSTCRFLIRRHHSCIRNQNCFARKINKVFDKIPKGLKTPKLNKI